MKRKIYLNKSKFQVPFEKKNSSKIRNFSEDIFTNNTDNKNLNQIIL